MSNTGGVDIQTRDSDDQTSMWRDAASIDWLELWQWGNMDEPGPTHPRDWLGDHVDRYAVSPFTVAMGLKLHPETPNWGLERARSEVTAAIQEGYLFQGNQDVVWPVEVMRRA